MSGRVQHEEYLDNLTTKNMEGYPELLKSYYCEGCAAQQTSRHVFINTVKRFLDYLRDEKHVDIFDEDCWKRVNKRQVKDWFASIMVTELKDGTHKKLSGKTLKSYLITINNFFEFLLMDGYITENICPSQKEMSKMFPEDNDDKDVVYMTKDETDMVKKAILSGSKHPKRDYCIFVLGCRTGLRAQALSEIDIADIDFKGKKMSVIEKNRKSRIIRLSDDDIRIINEVIEENANDPSLTDHEALFVKTFKGETVRISAQYIGLVIKKYTACLDKHITPHKMRSTCITLYYQKTGNIYGAARKGGHESVETTKRYIGHEEEDIAGAELMSDII